jgi:hypothetical protein
MTEREVESLLLEKGDLPAGWSAVDVGDPPTEVPGAADIEGILVSSFFQRSDLGPYLVHMLLYAEDEEEAETAFAAIEEELESARILDDITAEVRSWETEPTTWDELGDETFAFKAIGDTGIIPVEADMVATRKGQFVNFIIHAELMVVDTELTSELTRTAVERLPERRANPEDVISMHREPEKQTWEMVRNLVQTQGEGTTTD